MGVSSDKEQWGHDGEGYFSGSEEDRFQIWGFQDRVWF